MAFSDVYMTLWEVQIQMKVKIPRYGSLKGTKKEGG